MKTLNPQTPKPQTIYLKPQTLITIMKNFTLITIFFGLLISNGLFAQTINSDVLPEIGDVMNSINADTNGIEPGASGTGIVWDFSNLTPSDDALANVFVDPADTPHNEEFPEADLASEIAVPGIGSTYSYYSLDGDEWNLLGSMSGDVKNDETPNPELVMVAPFNYGASVSDDYQGVMASAASTSYNFGEKTLTFDATGTLLIPNAEFGDAMRVKTIATRTDSTAIGATISLINTTTESYSWYVSGVVGPIVTVTYTSSESETIISGMPPVVTELPSTKSVNFNPDATPGVNAASQIDLSFNVERIYPTPADSEVFVNINSDKNVTVNARLFNLVGRQVAGAEWRVLSGNQIFTFDLSDLPSGIYLLNMEEGKAQGTYRVVKK